MPAWERWSWGDDAGLGEVESGKPGDPPGSPLYYCGRGGGGVGEGGEGQGFSYLLESHMTYLAGSHILRSWPGIRLNIVAEKCQGFVSIYF
jgi:hypothetical protein